MRRKPINDRFCPNSDCPLNGLLGLPRGFSRCAYMDRRHLTRRKPAESRCRWIDIDFKNSRLRSNGVLRGDTAARRTHHSAGGSTAGSPHRSMTLDRSDSRPMKRKRPLPGIKRNSY